MKELKWSQTDNNQPVAKIPLLFTFPPVQTLMKELTRLNSPHTYRIAYLGPRWGDSLTFHKKYSNGNYPFDDKNIAKNSALSNTMMHNQFYKNQIFYRAFQGMNPTLDLQKQMQFQSRFQGGNLDCVVKVDDYEYDLFLRIDSNTRGNINWFYFSIKNCPNKKKIKLNICNLTKNDTHYSKGLYPFTYSSNRPYWTQERILKTTFREKKLRYQFLYERLSLRTFYELSFQFQAKKDEEIKFAYCVPYNYSDLMQDLKSISSVAEIGSLGHSLTGVNIPMVMVGKHEQKEEKPVVLITSRVHPGESNSSLIMANFMKYLCFSQQAKFMRQRVITIIIPMLNPDGVILGNSRCGASGKDLNRQFRSRSKFMFPEVIQLKQLVDKISQTHDLELYLDFHGHSRKKNMFMFGPDYNITQPQYYKSRVFPKLLSNVTNIFRYYSCSYTISNDKRSTARAVMLNEMMIPLVFTVQSSLGYYHDYGNHKDEPFTRKKWEELGEFVVIALKEYFQGIQQYEQFIQNKRKAKKQIAEEIKQAALSTAPQPIFNKKIKKQGSPPKGIRQSNNKEGSQPKDIKMFKIFQEITQLQEKRTKQEKCEKGTQSEEESDSHNSEEQLEKEKLKEFSSMVTDYLEEQTKRKTNTYQTIKPKKQNNEKDKANKRQLKKRKQLKMNEQQMIFNQYMEKDAEKSKKRPEIRTQRQQRPPKKQDIFQHRDKKNKPEGLSKIYPIFKEQSISHHERQVFLAGHQFLDEEVDYLPPQKKSHQTKMNIRMFNFSKMVNPRYQQPRQIRIIKPPLSIQNDQYSKSLQIQYPVQRQNKPNINIVREESEDGRKTRQERKQQFQAETRSQKIKGGYPSSFYRIKYHNSQRKKETNKRQSQFYDFEQESLQTSPNTAKPKYGRRMDQPQPEFISEQKYQGQLRKQRMLAQLRRMRLN